MSYGIYVGKNLTADGSVFLAGYRDEPSSHWLEIIPEKEHPDGATIKVGATETAKFPGEQIEILQVGKTAAYITMNYSSYSGYVAPITNGGLNAHEVAARDIWSPSREELKETSPLGTLVAWESGFIILCSSTARCSMKRSWRRFGDLRRA